MKRLATILLFSLALFGCEKEEEPSIYRPGGPYQQALDGNGKRIVVRDAQNKDLGKWRERRQKLRVFGPDMSPLGQVTWTSSEAGEVKISVEPIGQPAILMEHPEPAVWSLPGRLRLERVKNGWAMSDDASKRLGYVASPEPDKFSIRDDYSSLPRAFARKGDTQVKTPAGGVVVNSTPVTDAVMLLPYAVDGLDNMSRAALGLWLTHVLPESTTTPAAAPEADAGAGSTRDADPQKN